MAAVPKPGEVRYRQMNESDVDRVYAIELAAYRFGWTDGIFRDCLRVGYHCMVQELDGRIVGYAIMSSSAGEAHLLNLCVAPPYQRRGLARQLLARILDLAHCSGADDVFLEVRPTNLAARHLYLSAGFADVGTRPNYYPAASGREDAMVMARSIRELPL